MRRPDRRRTAPGLLRRLGRRANAAGARGRDGAGRGGSCGISPRVHADDPDAAARGRHRAGTGGAPGSGRGLPKQGLFRCLAFLGARSRQQLRAWQRLPETRANDDNPDIADYIGRAELQGFWNLDARNTLGLTLRHLLRTTAHGSLRLEWLRTLGDDDSRLRFHVQLFSGYGDSLIDFNRRRTVLGVGLSLVDF